MLPSSGCNAISPSGVSLHDTHCGGSITEPWFFRQSHFGKENCEPDGTPEQSGEFQFPQESGVSLSH